MAWRDRPHPRYHGARRLELDHELLIGSVFTAARPRSLLYSTLAQLELSFIYPYLDRPSLVGQAGDAW